MLEYLRMTDADWDRAADAYAAIWLNRTDSTRRAAIETYLNLGEICFRHFGSLALGLKRQPVGELEMTDRDQDDLFSNLTIQVALRFPTQFQELVFSHSAGPLGYPHSILVALGRTGGSRVMDFLLSIVSDNERDPFEWSYAAIALRPFADHAVEAALLSALGDPRVYDTALTELFLRRSNEKDWLDAQEEWKAAHKRPLSRDEIRSLQIKWAADR